MAESVVILGAGISGISAGYHLKKANIKPIIFEQNNTWGGLCDNFEIDGFRFDKFVHLSFSKDDYVNELFSRSAELNVHYPDPINYFNGTWLKHPAQNNLYNLSVDDKVKIIKDFANRVEKEMSEINDYESWLKCQYGKYFAENFPMKYTKKYWTVPAKELETKWVGNRMYKPTLEEVLHGAFSEETPNTYYANEMRYPKRLGYKNFLNSMTKDLDIKLGYKANKINLEKKEISFSNGETVIYDILISSLPLTELCEILTNVPLEVKEASKNLKWTSGAIISLGFNKPDIMKNLWTYIYDEDILTSRIYSPSAKAIENVPKNCSSIQGEVYFSYSDINSIKLDDVLESEINKYIEMGIFRSEDLIVKDIRVEKYANIIFDHNIYKNRDIVRHYFEENGINSIGRFGEWEYYWSDQSLISGKKCAEKILKKDN